MATGGSRRGVTLLLVTALLSIPSVASGTTQVGLLDPTFGGDGRVETDLSTIAATEDAAYGVAVQPNGKILAAGYRNSSSDTWMALVRYDSDGTLDPTFGGDGVVLTHFASGADGSAIALQPDGKIVVVGTAWIGYPASVWSFAVARYNEDGTLDDSFSEDGRIRTPIGDEDSEAHAVALQDDGSIVVAGEAMEGEVQVFAVARYTAEGSLDGSFGVGGTTTTSLGPFSRARDVAVQANGDIIVVGTAGAQNVWDLAVARYGADGMLDATFGTGGVVRTSFGEGQAQANGLALQPDGRIVVAGSGGSGDFVVVRYEKDGSIDPAFAGDGVRTVAFSAGPATASDVSLEPGGTIVAVGTAGGSSDTVFAVARLETDGSLDQRFSGDGKVLTSFGAGFASANSVALGADGSIVAGGSSPTTSRGDESDFALVRYVVPASRPDARLPWGTGDDIYNVTGRHQTLGDWRRSHTTFVIRIENDGSSADSFTVRGQGSTQKFRITYLMDGASVTARVVAGTLALGPIQPGAVTSLKIQIRARSSASPGMTIRRQAWISSTVDDDMVDAVRVVLHLVDRVGCRVTRDGTLCAS